MKIIFFSLLFIIYFTVCNSQIPFNTLKITLEDKLKYEKLPWCEASNLKLHLLSYYPHNFYLENDGTFTVLFKHCKLKTFNYDQAYECLKGQHLAYIGDSLTRYSSINLMALFARKRWENRIDNPRKTYFFLTNLNNPKRPASPQSIGHYLISFQNFFQEVNKVLNNEDYYSFSRSVSDITLSYNRFQNEYFHHIKKNYIRKDSKLSKLEKIDEQIKNDIRITYLSWYGSKDMTGQYELTFTPYLKELFPSYADYINAYVCKKGTMIPLNVTLCTSRNFHNFFQYGYSPINNCTYDNDVLKSIEKHCYYIEKDILSSLGVTHLIANFGQHFHNLNHTTPNLFNKLINGKLFLLPPRGQNRIHLPQVTWRETLAPNNDLYFERKLFDYFLTVPELNNEIVNPSFNFYNISLQSSVNQINLIHDRTHRFIQNSNNNIYNYLNLNSTMKKVDNYIHSIDEDYIKIGRIAFYNITADLLDLEEVIKNITSNSALKNIQESDRIYYTIKTFDERLLNANLKFFRTSRHDKNHYQSWVYNQLNNIFLNSICPHISTNNYKTEWDELIDNYRFNQFTKIN